MPYLLLQRFRSLFDGKLYRHRASNLGDSVAWNLPEDLYALDRSPILNARIDTGRCVLNLRNTLRGIISRRGDATFGEAVPRGDTVVAPGFRVQRGEIATVEIGIEVKILAKAMIKQIDRVISDLTRQVDHFRSAGGNPVSVGIVGINSAEKYVSHEGKRTWPTDGRKHKHPIQEAAEAEARLLARAAPAFDEFLVLRFRASNEPPFAFEWLDQRRTELDYGAALTRILRKYEERFS
ncbi:MAG TPA: hypothetical protein VFA12_09920 [Stellaceae bacterium]|nr:hypothetical protein [Stellaceae bacterium]